MIARPEAKDNHHIKKIASDHILRLLKEQHSQEIHGGLRCRTYSLKVLADYVYKFGDFHELKKQDDYLQALPQRFKTWFPRVLELAKMPDGNEGIMVMQRLDGRTLHEVLWDNEISSDAKLEVLQQVLDRLRLMHVSPLLTGPKVERDWRTVWQSVMARMPSTARQSFLSSAPTDATSSFSKTHVIQGRLIHGDAQAGNVMVNLQGDKRIVHFIDPLGGSSVSPGDYLYDYSRLYHWLDYAGECYESEKKQEPSRRAVGKRSYQATKEKLMHLCLQSMTQAMKDYGDQDNAAWFYLYLMFHTSGKMNNWLSDSAQELMLSRMHHYLDKLISLTTLGALDEN